VPERFVPVSPDRIHRTADLDRALFLHEFLVSQQTSADGLVFYGKAVGYAWIKSRWLGSPTIRSLQRYMRLLKSAGLVEVHREFHGGIRIRLLDSVKFAKPIPPPAVQLSLLGPGVTTMRKRAVDKLWKTSESPENNNDSGVVMVPTAVSSERSRK
jgi:hypothetical protein